MKKHFVVILFALVFACSEQPEVGSVQIDQTVAEKVDELVASVQPIFATLRNRPNTKDAPKLITYEVVLDRSTGTVTLLNFQFEDFFPIDAREAYARIAADTYSVDCTVGGKTTSTSCDGKISCGRAIASCLEQGGCATICKAPFRKEIYGNDITFFETLGVPIAELTPLAKRPVIDLEKGTREGTLSSVKISSLVW